MVVSRYLEVVYGMSVVTDGMDAGSGRLECPKPPSGGADHAGLRALTSANREICRSIIADEAIVW
jgi:hypothetical protein